MLKALGLVAPPPLGHWRMDIETGHFFGTEDVHAIFDLPYAPGAANLVDLLSRLHEEDRILIAQTFEHESLHKVGFHYATRSIAGAAATRWRD